MFTHFFPPSATDLSPIRICRADVLTPKLCYNPIIPEHGSIT